MGLMRYDDDVFDKMNYDERNNGSERPFCFSYANPAVLRDHLPSLLPFTTRPSRHLKRRRVSSTGQHLTVFPRDI